MLRGFFVLHVDDATMVVMWRLEIELAPAQYDRRRSRMPAVRPALGLDFRRSNHPLYEQTLHPQRQTHVARDAQLAGHEGDLPVELAIDEIEIVRRRHRDRDVR